MTAPVTVEQSGAPGVWLVRMGGRVFASQVVVLLGEKVELPGAQEVAAAAPPSPYEAALAALFPPGSRALWQDLGGLLRPAEVLSAPSFDRRSVRTEHGEREVHLSELRPC